MALRDDVIDGISRALTTNVQIRYGERVPDKRDLKFLDGGGAVHLNATYAYADLADSSKLAQTVRADITANIMRSYVNAAARVFRAYGGQIRSFDGDRVMAIFVGADKNAQAARAALVLNWAVHQVVNPRIAQLWPDVARIWTMKHGVGVATGEALVVRGGLLTDNDMISVGGAPNIAAKLSSLRPTAWGPQYSLYITQEVYAELPDDARITQAPIHTLGDIYHLGSPFLSTNDMWDGLGVRNIGGSTVYVRGSAYMSELTG